MYLIKTTGMSDKKPKISVILPFYNAEKTLGRAISSIANQTFRDFECILIDNNSTDNSKKKALQVIESDSRFILTSEEKQGVTFASNKGWELSKGNYIARMDADDWSHPERLDMQSDFLDKNIDYGAVGSLVKHIAHSNETGGMLRFVEWSNSIVSETDILNNRFTELPIVNPTAMWRREVAESHGMYRDGEFPEDYEMWLRWLDKGVRIAKINRVLLNWYDSDTRISRTKSIYSDTAFYRIKSLYLANWLRKNNPHHPNVAIWGASKISRRRAKLLEEYGINIQCYIDTKQTKRDIDNVVYYYRDIPPPQQVFVLTYIKQKEARTEIREFLASRSFTEGKNFLVVS